MFYQSRSATRGIFATFFSHYGFMCMVYGKIPISGIFLVKIQLPHLFFILAVHIKVNSVSHTNTFYAGRPLKHCRSLSRFAESHTQNFILLYILYLFTFHTTGCFPNMWDSILEKSKCRNPVKCKRN